VPTVWDAYVEPETTYSEGLEYTLSDDGSYYIVADLGTCKDAHIVIPPTYSGLPVTGISGWAFSKYYDVISITIPSTVTEIGKGEFYDCAGLIEFIVDPDNACYKSVDGNLYTKDGKTLIKCAMAKTKVTILYGVTEIGDSAFLQCRNLKSIEIPDSVTSIGSYAFAECISLTKVYYTGTEAEWNRISIGTGNNELLNATRYYYSETQPTTAGNFWHYVDGVPTVW
jgi:hypothetical protein